MVYCRLAAIALASLLGDAAAQSMQTTGSCSPIILGTGTRASITVSCGGISQRQLQPLIDEVVRLTPQIEDAKRHIERVLQDNAQLSSSRLSDLLTLSNRQLYETKRLEYKLDYENVLGTFAGRFPVTTGAMSGYGNRMASQFGINGAWTSLWPFSQIEWLSQSDSKFPSDKSVRDFFSKLNIGLYCFSREQQSSTELGSRISSVNGFDTLNPLTTRAFFRQDFRLSPSACGTGVAVGEAFNIKALLINATAVPPVAGSVVKPGNLTSAVDLFGSVCYALVYSDAFPESPQHISTVDDAVMLTFKLHLTRQHEASGSSNVLTKIESRPGMQVFRWSMPTRVADLNKVQVVNDFPPTPHCR